VEADEAETAFLRWGDWQASWAATVENSVYLAVLIV
jgi:hypothetical protein